MGRNKKPDAKTEWIKARVTKKTKARVRMLTSIYAGGNESKWVEHGALEAPRRKLR